jgi:hypothetical protein
MPSSGVGTGGIVLNETEKTINSFEYCVLKREKANKQLA